jgi:hypothetical protein
MSVAPRMRPRSFTTKFFAKLARKAGIAEKELCRVLTALADGKGTDLGGGVYKKRLNENEYRSIIVAKSDAIWVFAFLYAKNDADNITSTALEGFRTIADTYSTLKPAQLARLIKDGDLKEICK